jgi:conjugative transfer signal peptidase TraF
VCAARTPLAAAPGFKAFSASIRNLSKLLSFAAAGTILIAALGSAARKLGLVITITDSSCPVGIYRLVRKPGARGQLVESCLPYAIATYGIERGYIGSGDCPDGTEPVVKVVGAVFGDSVGLSRNAVTVNGWKLANSASIFRDGRGREVRRVTFDRYQTGANEVWLFGLNDPRSWDSRYFGPIPDHLIRGTLQPVLTLAR